MISQDGQAQPTTMRSNRIVIGGLPCRQLGHTPCERINKVVVEAMVATTQGSIGTSREIMKEEIGDGRGGGSDGNDCFG